MAFELLCLLQQDLCTSKSVFSENAISGMFSFEFRGITYTNAVSLTGSHFNDPGQWDESRAQRKAPCSIHKSPRIPSPQI